MGFVTHLGTSQHRDQAGKNVGGRHLKALSKQIRTNEPPLTWAVCVTVGHGDPGPGVLILDFQKLTGRPTSHLPRECKSDHSVNSPVLDNEFCGPVFCNVVSRSPWTLNFFADKRGTFWMMLWRVSWLNLERDPRTTTVFLAS